MIVYIIHRDVDYEFGHVHSVHTTEDGAQAALDKFLSEDQLTAPNPNLGGRVFNLGKPNPTEYSIQEFEVQP